MGRKDDDIRSSESDSDSTDSEADYSPPSGREEMKRLFIKQRGLCRITNMPFGEGVYAPTIVSRCLTKPRTSDNMMLVLAIVEQLHSGVAAMPWNLFASHLRQLGDRAEL
mgnify:CR=1 FL=1